MPPSRETDWPTLSLLAAMYAARQCAAKGFVTHISRVEDFDPGAES